MTTNDGDDGKILTLRIDCLSGIAELERECTKRNLKLTAETSSFLMRLTLQKLGAAAAQKLLSKLVDKGKISWSEGEDFEVEAILDFQLGDDGDRYYLIKWNGWNAKYNTWEPEHNLNCPEMISQYHERRSQRGMKRKRLSVGSIEQGKTVQERIDDLYRRIVLNCESLTPHQLLGLDEKHLLQNAELKRYRERGLIANVGQIAPHNFKKAGTKSRKTTKSYKQMKEESQNALQAWAKKINGISKDPSPILVENEVDLEGPPAGFTYISDYIAGSGIQIPNDPLVGCECTDCSECRQQCCPANMGSDQPYTKRGKKLRVPPGTPVYECNRRCACDESCPNRVVQLGRKFKLCIFRTSNSRGWGVKTAQKIKRGSFVMEYFGEVITSEEAEARGKIYDSEGMTYLFDLDFNDGDNPYTVDARNYGNVSHFVNHSCDPNLAVYGVWINNLDPSLPRIALFARRDIDKNEELTFDYMMTLDRAMSPTGRETPIENGFDDLDDVKDIERVEEENEDPLKSDIAKENESKDIDIAKENESKDIEMIGNESMEITKDVEYIDYNDLVNNNSLLKTPKKGENDGIEEVVSPKERLETLTTPKKSENDGIEKVVSPKTRSEALTTPKNRIVSFDESPTKTSQGETANESNPVTPRSRAKNAFLGLRSPIGAKNRIKCQCGSKKCRGFLF